MKVIITGEARSHGTYILYWSLKKLLQDVLQIYLFLGKSIIYFCLIIRFSVFFPMFLTLRFVSCVLFHILSRRKAAFSSKHTHCHSCIHELLSTWGLGNSPLFFGAYQLISLLNLSNSATTILYHSSVALNFPSVR